MCGGDSGMNIEKIRKKHTYVDPVGHSIDKEIFGKTPTPPPVVDEAAVLRAKEAEDQNKAAITSNQARRRKRSSSLLASGGDSLPSAQGKATLGE